MLREFRLFKATWVTRIQKPFDNLSQWIDQSLCRHVFRPAVEDKTPARVCKFCDKLELLTKEEFFAYFGEVGQGMLH